MLKLIPILAIFTSSALTDFCPDQRITSDTVGGNLPNGVKNPTDVPLGTNCAFDFDIPANYYLKLVFNVQFGSTADKITIFRYFDEPIYTLNISTNAVSNPYYLPAGGALVQVEGNSGAMMFMLSYTYQKLDNHKQITKRTGEPFPLSLVTANTYVTITASAYDHVALSPASRWGVSDATLSQFFVFDGDNINTTNVMGKLSDFAFREVSSGQSVSIVNFAGVSSASYVLGNDASTLEQLEMYTVILTSLGSSNTGRMVDESGTLNGVAFTWICTDCSTFYWTDFSLEGMAGHTPHASFQGQTPTHRKERLISYDSTTTKSYFPQLVPTNIMTMYLVTGIVDFHVNNINDDTAWRKAYPGRKGYIFAPSLWGTLAGNLSYDIRDASQLYDFTVNIDEIRLPTSFDQMTLKIGSGTGAPTVDNLYPRDQSTNNKVVGSGNYLQVGIVSTVECDIRLSFEMKKSASGTIGILNVLVLSLTYVL